MIPKSLGIALVAGMCSGIAAALVLADVREGMDAQDPPAAPAGSAASLAVLTDMAEYQRGQPVRITVVNSGGTPAVFADASYGLAVTGLAGEGIFSPASGQQLLQQQQQQPDHRQPVLEPGARHHLAWNQHNDDGRQVADGIYRISVRGLDADTGAAVGDSRTVDIYEIDLTFES